MKIDLHMHSLYSDGDETPEELVRQCAKEQVAYAALTDHDTVSGVDKFLSAAKENGIRAVSGIELSALRHKEVHILGYGIEHRAAGFLRELTKIQKLRCVRNAEILKTLKKNGIYLTQEDISSQREESAGRMHIAKAMVKKAYSASIGEAFEKWLGYGKRAYVPAYRLTPREAVELVVQYGGCAVLAHPMKLNMTKDELKRLAGELKGYGLSGIEAYYVSHTKEESGMLREIANGMGLIATCGSDFHGAGRIARLGEVEHQLTDKDLAPLF